MHSGSTSAKVDDKNQRTFTATSYPICRLVLLAVQMFFFFVFYQESIRNLKLISTINGIEGNHSKGLVGK